MTAKDLKNALLQEAVMGKLVPQIASEGNAKDLLEEIKNSHTDLQISTKSAGTDKKNSDLRSKSQIRVTKKELPQITDEEVPFDIPESWCWCRLGEIVPFGQCENADPNEIKDDAWILDLEDIEKDSGVILQFKTKKDADSKSTKHIFKKGFVLYSKLRPYLNKCVIAPKDGYCTSEILPLDFGKFVNNKFAQIFLMSPYFVDYTNSLSFGVKMPRLGTEDGKKALFPLPPLAEQKRIVAAIEKFMPLIEEYGKKESALNLLNAQIASLTKKAILQEAVQGRLVPQIATEGNAKDLLAEIKKSHTSTKSAGAKSDLRSKSQIRVIKKELPPITQEEIPFDIPDSWCWCRLGEIGDWKSGSTPSRTKPEFYNGNIPWLKTGDLNDGYITEIPEFVSDLALENCSMRLNPVGSVLIAMYGATIGKVGILNIPATTNQACCACICPDGLFNKYLFYYLMSQKTSFTEQAEGGAQPNISREKIVNYLIPLPPLAEQKRIVSAIEKLLPLCKKLGQ